MDGSCSLIVVTLLWLALNPSIGFPLQNPAHHYSTNHRHDLFSGRSHGPLCGTCRTLKSGDIVYLRNMDVSGSRHIRGLYHPRMPSPYSFSKLPPAHHRYPVSYPPPYGHPYYPYGHPFRPRPHQYVKPRICTWKFEAIDDCQLLLNFEYFETGDHNCHRQYVLVADEEREIQICGFAQAPIHFKAMGSTLFIKHFRKPQSWTTEFEASVACIKNRHPPEVIEYGPTSYEIITHNNSGTITTSDDINLDITSPDEHNKAHKTPSYITDGDEIVEEKPALTFDQGNEDSTFGDLLVPELVGNVNGDNYLVSPKEAAVQFFDEPSENEELETGDIDSLDETNVATKETLEGDEDNFNDPHPLFSSLNEDRNEIGNFKTETENDLGDVTGAYGPEKGQADLITHKATPRQYIEDDSIIALKSSDISVPEYSEDIIELPGKVKALDPFPGNLPNPESKYHENSENIYSELTKKNPEDEVSQIFRNRDTTYDTTNPKENPTNSDTNVQEYPSDRVTKSTEYFDYPATPEQQFQQNPAGDTSHKYQNHEYPPKVTAKSYDSNEYFSEKPKQISEYPIETPKEDSENWDYFSTDPIRNSKIEKDLFEMLNKHQAYQEYSPEKIPKSSDYQKTQYEKTADYFDKTSVQDSDPTKYSHIEPTDYPDQLYSKKITEKSEYPNNILEKTTEYLDHREYPLATETKYPSTPEHSDYLEYSKKPAEYPSEKPAEYPSEKPAEYPSEKPAEYPFEKPSEYPSEKPAEYPSKIPSEYPSDKPAEHLSERPAEYPSEKPAEYLPEKPAKYPSEKPEEYLSEIPSEYPSDKPAEHPSERPAEYPSEKPAEYLPEKATEYANQYHAEKTTEHSGYEHNASEKVTEYPNQYVSEHTTEHSDHKEYPFLKTQKYDDPVYFSEKTVEDLNYGNDPSDLFKNSEYEKESLQLKPIIPEDEEFPTPQILDQNYQPDNQNTDTTEFSNDNVISKNFKIEYEPDEINLTEQVTEYPSDTLKKVAQDEYSPPEYSIASVPISSIETSEDIPTIDSSIYEEIAKTMDESIPNSFTYATTQTDKNEVDAPVQTEPYVQDTKTEADTQNHSASI